MECGGCSFDDIPTIRNTCGTSPNVTMFMSLVDLLIRSNCRVSDPCRRRTTSSGLKSYEYDFIVVGGGVAGSVVASRLSENPEWSVLLLEAGPEEPTETGVPAYFMSAVGSEVDWGFRTQPQRGACLDTDGSCYWPRGKMLGGTGSMTGMMYMRGHRSIYDGWAKQGNVGWSYDEVLPFFKMSENNKNPELIEKDYHGTGGPLTVQRFSSLPDFAHDLIEAGAEIGYRTGDLNGANQTGFTIAQVMVDDGIRASTPRMYLRPAHDRKNLHVSINSHVTRVLIDETSKVAVGVEFVDADGIKILVSAKKEVILSAGAVGSPHLLLLSGVGPAQDLRRHNITVIQDLKVGHNLQNHVAVDVPILIKDENRRLMTMNTLSEYLEKGTGPMSSTGLTQVTAFLTSKHAQKDVPDLQVFFDGFSAGCSSTGRPDECNDGTFNTHCGEREINARPTNLLPHSRGYLTLKSSDPMEYPLIYPNYLSRRNDVNVLIDGIRQVTALTKTEALKKFNARLNPKPQPKCAKFKFATRKYWECVIRTYTGPENHQVGTCKMGTSMEDAVVCPELRVHGIPNLRVIDASIFPSVPNGNPISAIVMAAEKGAHMIRNAWQSNRSKNTITTLFNSFCQKLNLKINDSTFKMWRKMVCDRTGLFCRE